jgi:uncharacterized protein (TIGR03437 family)
MKNFSAFIVSLTFGVCLTAVTAPAQQAAVDLGSDSTFAVLGGTTVTVTGGGTITGNVGIFPGTAYVAGTPAVTVNGTVYAGGPVASQAQADLTTAFNNAAGRTVAPITVSGNIGGQTLAPGLYKSTSSLAISSGDLTLDAQGNANAVWIFQIASTLTTTSGRQVILANGANAGNIFWQVGSSATIGTTSVFQGNILAAVSITMATGSTLSGRALAIGGAVSIDTGGGTSATIPVAPTAPTVTSTVPVNGATGVPIGNQLSATFSTAMNASTITASTFTLTQGAAPVSGVVTYLGTTATFTPASTMAPLKTFTATITTGAADTAGNTLASAYVWTFTTGASVSVTLPTVTSTVPANGATSVAIGNQLSATFSEAMNPATISASTFTLTHGGAPVAGAVTYSGTTATFAPVSSLLSATSYTATITTGAQDLAGDALAANYVWSFTTGSSVDTTPPTVISTIPATGAQGVTIGSNIAATFSEAMNPLTISTATFTLQQGATAVPGTVTYSGTTATFTPFSTLSAATTYTATITNGAQDLAGNPLAGNYVWSFTTGAAVVSTGPVIQLSGTVNGASFVAPVAAGSIAGVFGTNLSIGQASSMVPTPLPSTLAQSSFTIGGQSAPLFFAMPGQVNLQIPWDMAGQTQAAVIATVNGIASTAETVAIVPFAPGIFTMNASGAGQGAVLIAPTAVLAGPGTPVSRGAYVSIFCTGLGAVTNQPATGVAAGSSPLSISLTTPTVTIGGIGAVVSYSGLAPTFAGLYQINAVVPLGVSPGNTVSVVISIGSISSNTVTIAVQ